MSISSSAWNRVKRDLSEGRGFSGSWQMPWLSLRALSQRDQYIQGRQLKLYTVYSPPNHPAGTIHKTKAEAETAEAQSGH
jgi:hypothetical protein